MAKCKYCPAEIIWVKMKTGGMMPVDKKPIKMVFVDYDVIPKNFGGGSSEESFNVRELHGRMVEARDYGLFVPHWATCPGAKEAKKKGGK